MIVFWLNSYIGSFKAESFNLVVNNGSAAGQVIFHVSHDTEN